MNKFVTLLALTLAACGIDTSQQLSPAVTDGSDLETWAAEVESAVAHWQHAIGTCCAFPLSVGVTGSPITLVVVSALPDARARTTTGNDQRDVQKIDVRDDMSPFERHGVIMHELGHAIGLGHVAEPESIMCAPSTVSAPSASDVMRARKVLSCT